MASLNTLLELLFDLTRQGVYFEECSNHNGTRITKSGKMLCVDDVTLLHYAITKQQNQEFQTTAFCEVYTGQELSFAAQRKHDRYVTQFIRAGYWFEKLKTKYAKSR